MEEINKGLFYSGTSGLVLPVPNKQLYPIEFQDKSRLTYYASIFNSIEINSSFYKIPMPTTVFKWAESVPDGFRFTFKLWREITHNKGLTFNPEDVDRFVKTISQVGTKKGTLLVQFPPSLKVANIHRLQELLVCLMEANTDYQWKIAMEFRNKTWYHEEIYDLLDQYQVGLVIQDMPASATPFVNSDLPFGYLRFHGPNGSYKGSYDNDFLSDYASVIRELNTDGKEIYAYFNNTAGDAVKNLMTLNSLVASDDY